MHRKYPVPTLSCASQCTGNVSFHLCIPDLKNKKAYPKIWNLYFDKGTGRYITTHWLKRVEVSAMFLTMECWNNSKKTFSIYATNSCHISRAFKSRQNICSKKNWSQWPDCPLKENCSCRNKTRKSRGHCNVCMVRQPLGSRLKCVSNYWRGCDQAWSRHASSPEDQTCFVMVRLLPSLPPWGLFFWFWSLWMDCHWILFEL